MSARSSTLGQCGRSYRVCACASVVKKRVYSAGRLLTIKTLMAGVPSGPYHNVYIYTRYNNILRVHLQRERSILLDYRLILTADTVACIYI